MALYGAIGFKLYQALATQQHLLVCFGLFMVKHRISLDYNFNASKRNLFLYGHDKRAGYESHTLLYSDIHLVLVVGCDR